MRRRLMAIDIDGTLVRKDGTVADADREAIAQAQEYNVVVTLATGRLTQAAVPLAQELGIDAPLVCADGAVIINPTTSKVLRLYSLGPMIMQQVIGNLRAHTLTPFAFTHDAILGHADDIGRFPFLNGWTNQLTACLDLDRLVTGPPPLGAITLIGVGGQKEANQSRDLLSKTPGAPFDLDMFPVDATDHWVVRTSPEGCTKALGLKRLAEMLGIPARDVAAVGDWYNDIAMLAWAPLSFAMGHAPDTVRRAAKRRLSATAETGGGVAEAVEYFLSIADD